MAGLVEYFELTLKTCTRTYGAGACTAVVGSTGPFKCYNSPATCQVPAAYVAGTQVVRWVNAQCDASRDIDAIPSLVSLSIRPQEIKPGESLGVRESVSVSFSNHPHNDSGFDKYLSSRAFNPYNQGTFWRKFAARWPNIKGFECCVIRGTNAQTLAQMERRYYVVDATSGPGGNGGFSITAKDAIKFLDDDKAQAPAVSAGSLSANITNVSTSFTLSPSGIGNSSYPASGIASLGDEAVSFTRSGDVVTLTARELYGSKLGAHNAGETFQLALVFNSLDVSAIINTLLGYTKTPAEYFDVARWSDETTINLGELFSSKIMKPTGIRTLINELIEQAGLVMWTDTRNKKIRLLVLRALAPAASYSDDVFLQGSLNANTNFEKHRTNIMYFYGPKNPLKKVDDPENYAGILNQFSIQAVDVLEDIPLSTGMIYSRWTTIANSSAARYVCDLLLARYGTPPKTLSFSLPYAVAPQEGSVVNIQSRVFEDAQGAMAAPTPFFLTRVEPVLGSYKVVAEQMILPPVSVSGLRRVYISNTTLSINLKELHDAIYTPAVSGNSILFIIENDVIVGSSAVDTFAIYNPAWPAGVSVSVEWRGGRTQGKGGAGGYYWTGDRSGGGEIAQPGGGAFKTDSAVTLINPIIWGGGGGGSPASGHSSSGGGGGAGWTPGNGATATAGGFGYAGGALGGNPGLPGNALSGYTAGVAGKSIQGLSLCTITGTSDIRGPTAG